ncbi:hypothetical protein LG3211_2222 [Lysobacter gummosus]|uniref:Uncharacterized protein n=1 Tax=Lysobacter capsici AZ78 TaxID=1444315 RepID=A0A108U4X4_9GAMM|nr:hypothetical protein LG3211_2222 [Lysobacter gummosus]KWS02623.1 hypothetical protein AZ78_0167 [Lysobacter capsici AZ78]
MVAVLEGLGNFCHVGFLRYLCVPVGALAPLRSAAGAAT